MGFVVPYPWLNEDKSSTFKDFKGAQRFYSSQANAYDATFVAIAWFV